ncbi:MAG: hypothetical protein O7B23_03915, partial [Deltaproteobacteria bacterium]|nr:hypothetical protein [Deltaproteobacteria bacterium]
MSKSGIAIALLVVAASVVSSSARADVIDFNALTEGEIVSSVFGSGGGGPVAVFGTNPSLLPSNAAVIFDSDCTGGCSGEDPDLGSPNKTCPGGGPGKGDGGEFGQPNENCTRREKILIVADDLVDSSPADGFVDDPDDNAGPSQLAFDFSAVGPGHVTVISLTIMDVELSEAAAIVTLKNGGPDIMIPLPKPGDNGVASSVSLGPTSNVVTMTVDLSGSGAIDDLTFEYCGDGVTNPALGEECDDGNNDDGDCCSAACEFEDAGSACDDEDACTSSDGMEGGPDASDGLGTCQGMDVTCDDTGNDCTVAICEGGTCSPANEDDGTECGNAGDGLCDLQDTCV